jgi:hypothetical protein
MIKTVAKCKEGRYPARIECPTSILNIVKKGKEI